VLVPTSLEILLKSIIENLLNSELFSAMGKKIVNGLIVDDNILQSQSDGGMETLFGGSFNLFGYKIPVWMLGVALTFIIIFGGFKGLMFFSILVFLAYVCQSNGSQTREVTLLHVKYLDSHYLHTEYPGATTESSWYARSSANASKLLTKT